MSYKPFKMKGSPIKRNFGVGSKVLSRSGSLFKFTIDDLKKKSGFGPTEKENKELIHVKGSGPHGLFDMENPKDREKLYNITEKERK